MSGPAWRPQVQKLHIYEGIFKLNRAFHATLMCLEQLENLGFFRSEYLNACKIELEHTRASANDELVETLREYEQEEGGRFYRMQKEWDDQFKDSDDVFFAAKKRKEEIKKQVRTCNADSIGSSPAKRGLAPYEKRRFRESNRCCRCELSRLASESDIRSRLRIPTQDFSQLSQSGCPQRRLAQKAPSFAKCIAGTLVYPVRCDIR